MLSEIFIVVGIKAIPHLGENQHLNIIAIWLTKKEYLSIIYVFIFQQSCVIFIIQVFCIFFQIYPM